MSKKPLISIITVNLNDLEGLKKTIKSVFDQTWQEFEFIVIDGGSTDGSKELIEENKERIDHWVSEPDNGIYNAMNKGIELASGEYLFFLNSGDHFVNPQILENNREFITGYDLIYFDINVVEEADTYLRYFPEKLVFSYFTKHTLPHQGTFIKAELFKNVGYYDEKFKIVADWKFFLESICDFNATYHKVDDVLTYHYLDGVSTDPKNWSLIVEERKEVLESGYGFFLDDSQQLFEYREKVGEMESIISNLRKSRKIALLVKLGLINKF